MVIVVLLSKAVSASRMVVVLRLNVAMPVSRGGFVVVVECSCACVL